MRKIFTFLLLWVTVLSFGQKAYLFIGTYTNNGSKGIYVYHFDLSTGKAEWVSNTDSSANPSYLAISPNRKFVYAVNETTGATGGDISAYAFDRSSGKLKFINKQSTGGDNPCYVAINNTSNWVTVANYTGGSVAAYPVNKNGSLNPYAQLIQDEGSSVNKNRQEKAHVHSTVFSPDHQYLFTPDLGIDKVMAYQFKPALTKPLVAATPSFVAAVPGSGPRHITFSPNGKFAYLSEELSGSVVVYQYKNGKLVYLQSMITHPEGYKGVIGTADLHVSPDGKFLYVSNRGDENTLTIFSISPTTGKLVLKGYTSVLGKTPRNFTIDPSGKYLLVANQATNNIVIFKRDAVTGLLTATGEEIKIPSPVYLQVVDFSK